MPVATVSGRVRPAPSAGPGEKELGRAGRDDQPGRVAPAVVELLPGGRLERDHQLDRARGERVVGGRWVCRAGPVDPCASAGMATRTSRCAADSTTTSRAVPSPARSTTASLGSASPLASVDTRLVAGSNRRIAPL